MSNDNLHPCPVCGSKTDFYPDCPGYGSPGKVMVCYPYCGNAMRFFCTSKICSWWYRYPNNRKAEGMGIVPSWNYQFIDELDDPPLESEDTMEEETKETIPDGMPGLIEGARIHYVAYNYRHLAGLVIGYDPAHNYDKADIWILTNMSNINGDKNFGEQFHQDVPYSKDPKPGTWHFLEQKVGVGSHVLYVLESGPHKGDSRPAIVVRDWKQANGLVQLQVFTDGLNDGFEAAYLMRIGEVESSIVITQNTIWRTSVLYDEEKTPGTWHWADPS